MNFLTIRGLTFSKLCNKPSNMKHRPEMVSKQSSSPNLPKIPTVHILEQGQRRLPDYLVVKIKNISLLYRRQELLKVRPPKVNECILLVHVCKCVCVCA